MTQHTTTPSFLDVIIEQNIEMPMRDGTILRANICRPAASGRYPALLSRTPYGKDQPEPNNRFARAGYVVVSQDVRGRFDSDGEFVPFYTPATHAAEDGYDSVEWVAKQPWCDGNVGTMGVSYVAWTQWMLAKLCPPHLKAMNACSIPPDNFQVDYTGSYRPARRAHWLLASMAPDVRRRRGGPPPHTHDEAYQIWDEIERGRWLDILPWSKVLDHLPPELAKPFGHYMANPTQPIWRIDETYGEIEVPNLDITGWHDHCNATISHLTGMQRYGRTKTARQQSRVIIGPWNHVTLGQRKVGAIDFGPSAQMDVTDLQMRWFDHWLKGLDNGIDRQPAVQYFVMGSGNWKSAGTWPLPEEKQQVLHLHSEGKLVIDKPAGDQTEDCYTYDPDNPVPTLWGPMYFTEPANRRTLDYRNDILRYHTKPLTEDWEIIGKPEVVLFAASSAPDTDFFARLVDEDPQGVAVDVSYGMIRARHRNGLNCNDPLIPDQITEFCIPLRPVACRFVKGHSIRIEITSSDFPNFDRNHNLGRNDLYDAELAVAKQRVIHSTKYPSRLVMPRAET